MDNFIEAYNIKNINYICKVYVRVKDIYYFVFLKSMDFSVDKNPYNFKLPIDNGSVEGLNNKAKVISHRAYGFRSAKNYILNLYHCMADLPMPFLLHSFV